MARRDPSARVPLRHGGLLLACVLACGLAPARADEPDACKTEHGKPPADRALCAARPPPSAEDPALLLPRALLAIPRLVFRTATQLLTFGTGIEDDLHVSHRLTALSDGVELPYQLYPTVLYDTRGGVAGGLRFVHSNLFGAGERVSLLAVYGGRHRQLYEAMFDMGQRFGPLKPGISAAWEADDRGRFYGIGNGNTVAASSLDQPLDAQVPGPAVRARYQVDELRVTFSAERAFEPHLLARASQLWRSRFVSADESDTDTVWVNQVFEPSTLVGFGSTLVDAYTQLLLSVDNREALRNDTPRSLPGAGFRGVAWAGTQAALSEPHASFGRLGIDLNSFIDLYRGNRILRLRARAASAIGPLSAIPFLDLPQLGGSRLLRGYETGRFHGRLSVLGSVEYRYPVQERIAAYLFVDAGRVYAAVDDFSVSSLLHARVGFGMGLQLFTMRKALIRFQLASSIDGGLYFHLSLNTTDEPSATD